MEWHCDRQTENTGGWLFSPTQTGCWLGEIILLIYLKLSFILCDMMVSVSIPQFSSVIFTDSFNIHLLNTIMCQVLICTPNDKLVIEIDEDNILIITIVVIIDIIAADNIFFCNYNVPLYCAVILISCSQHFFLTYTTVQLIPFYGWRTQNSVTCMFQQRTSLPWLL